ncbi:MAG: diaminopimelate decarboxylase [Thermoplasmata archaeon]
MWKIEPPLENRNGTLYLGGINLMSIAEKYGTPVYVTDEQRIRNNYRRLRNAFAKRWKRFKLFYAVKANNNISILKILRQEGAGADCSCVPELQLASFAKFRVEDMLYTGNYNSNEELQFASQMGVAINLDDIGLLDKLARFGMPETICFRINPGFGKGGHDALVFAGKDVKFGISEAAAKKAYAKAKKLGAKKFGIHMMAGSSVLDDEYFGQVTDRLFKISRSISKSAKIEFDFVNIGGGFGVPYRPGEKDLDIEKIAKDVTDRFKEEFEDAGNPPYLYAEPGRYLVCDSTVLLSRVHHVKLSDRKFVGIDAGMNTLLRPALYGSYHQMYVVNKLNERRKETVNIVGQICENTDFLARDRTMPPIEEGDVIAILNAGAYGYSMSSNYNTRPRAAEVLIHDGEDFLIREREDITDILDRQRVPGRLLK